jgi:Protein of unknown function (DUF3306)
MGAPDPSADGPAEADAEPPPPDLPDVATLDGSSDYRPFMRPGVPKELRREALRKLWRTNPIINSLDGLDDHYVTHDFTDGATVVADLRTAYRVGKGMLDAVEELAAAAPDPPAARIEPAATPRRLEPGPDEDAADTATTVEGAQSA